MLNILKAQDQLKDLSDQQLGMEMQTGNMPQYLVLAEMQRRKKMRSEASQQVSTPTSTVAEDVVRQPIVQGIAGMPVKPSSFASGGIVSFASGGVAGKSINDMTEEELDAYMKQLDAENAKGEVENAAIRASLNQAPSSDYSFQNQTPTSGGIATLPEVQEYVRKPEEVAKDYKNKETSLLPEDYMTPDQLANHERVKKYLYGDGATEKGGIANAQTQYVPQADTKPRDIINIPDENYPPTLYPQEVKGDTESFKAPSTFAGSMGKPDSLLIPQEDNYAELQGIPQLLPKMQFEVPQEQQKAVDTAQPPVKQEGGIQTYLDQLKGDVKQPEYKLDRTNQLVEDLKGKMGDLEKNNLSMALMSASAAMLAGDSPFAMVNIGKGFQSGLAQYVSGKKDIRDLQKDIGKLEIEAENALNDRNMKMYETTMRQLTAATELYNKAIEGGKDREMHTGIANIQSADNRYGVDERAKSSKYAADMAYRGHQLMTNARNADKADATKEKLEQRNREQYNALVQKKIALRAMLADKMAMSSAPDKAAAMAELEAIDRVIKHLEPQVYPDMPPAVESKKSFNGKLVPDGKGGFNYTK